MPIGPMRPDDTRYDQALARRANPAPVQAPIQQQQRYTPPIQSNFSGQYSRPQAPPVEQSGSIGDIESYLGGDSGYQQQLQQLALALSDFNADVTRRKGTLESQFGLSKKALGDQRVKDLQSLQDDYGARGLAHSGLYGKAVSDYEGEYGNRSTELSTQNQQALGSLTQEQGQYSAQQKLREQAARDAAIARRAASYGV